MRQATYTLDGQTLTAFAFYQAAKAKYRWRGMLPSYLIGYRSPDGSKGCQRNPAAPPFAICEQIDDAIMNMSPEELARAKEEARQDAEALRREAGRT